MKKRQLYLCGVIVVLLVAIVYGRVLDGFFQQDEWMSFSFHIKEGQKPLIERYLGFFSPSVGHYQPLNTLFIHTLFLVFGLNYTIYALISILFHLVNVFLVYLLLKKLFGKVVYAIIGSLFFGFSASIYQATTWVLADLGIHLSTIFLLVSLIYFLEYTKTQIRKHFYIGLLLLLTSLLFKEIGLGMFVLIPWMLWFLPQPRLRYLKKDVAVVLVTGFLFILIRLIMLFIPSAYENDKLVVETQSYFSLAYNLITLPGKALVQLFIPAEILLKIAYFIVDFLPQSVTGEKNTPIFDIFVEKKLLEGVNAAIFLIIASAVFIAWFLNRFTIYGKVILLGTALVVLNSPLFALAPEKSGKIFLIDSRNLYFLAVGMSILFVSLVGILIRLGKLNWAIMGSIAILFLNIYFLNKNLEIFALEGSMRKGLLGQLIGENEHLPKRVVFYTESDISFYGLPEDVRILPFQSGFGQTLLVWYYPTEKFPEEFLKDRFLWEIGEQGYKESGNRGFGYYREFEALAQSVRDNKIPPNSVIAYGFDSKNNKLYRKDSEISGRLVSYLSKKRRVSSDSYTVNVFESSERAHFMSDSNLETYWAGVSSYSPGQEFMVKFAEARNLTLVRFDSRENKDLNKIGYSISLSLNGKDWMRVFESPIYPPDRKGITELYFQPTFAKFLKITQIGYHPKAKWRVNEMEIYEAIE